MIQGRNLPVADAAPARERAEGSTLKAHASRGVRWTTISSVVTNASEILRMLVLARILLPGDFGLMAIVLVVIGFAQTYTDLGLTQAIIHRQDATRQQLSSLYWLSVLTGVVATMAVWFSAPLVAAFFEEPRVISLVRVVATVFLLSGFSSQFETLLLKDLRFRTVAVQEIIASVCSFALGVAMALAGFGVWSLVGGFVGAAILKSLFLLQVGLKDYRPMLRFQRADIAGYLSFGMFQLGERSVNYIGSRLDQVLIGRLLGMQALGYYSFAFNFAYRPIWRINPVVTRVAFPLFSRLQNETDALRRGYIKVIGLLSMINAPLLLGLAAVAPVGVPVVFGEKWVPSVPLLQILALYALPRSVMNPIGALQYAKGRADLGFKWQLFMTLFTVPLIVVGAYAGGAKGVALALLLQQIILAVPFYRYMVRPLVGPCAREYLGVVARPSIVAGIVAIAVAMLPAWRGSPGMLYFVLQILSGATGYVLLLNLFDRASLRELRSVMRPS